MTTTSRGVRHGQRRVSATIPSDYTTEHDASMTLGIGIPRLRRLMRDYGLSLIEVPVTAQLLRETDVAALQIALTREDPWPSKGFRRS